MTASPENKGLEAPGHRLPTADVEFLLAVGGGIEPPTFRLTAGRCTNSTTPQQGKLGGLWYVFARRRCWWARRLVCAVVSNATSSPQRRLAWIGSYPDALKVPARPPPPRRLPLRSRRRPRLRQARRGTTRRIRTARGSAITGDEAAGLHRKGIPFLDARRTTVYEAGHIAGARSFPIWESTVEDAIKKLFEEGYDVNAPLVVYCSGGDCEDSHMLSQKLHGYGFNNALVYADGFPDWEKRGLPVTKGAAP